jgi:FMN phosphatase YigB (HAD superfamily)
MGDKPHEIEDGDKRQHCLLIDDNPENVHIAEWVGIPGIHFVDAEQLTTELERRQV